MKITKKKKIETEVTVGYKCEVCGKVVETEDEIFGFHVNHHDYEGENWWWIEVCSWECFLKKLPEVNKEYGRYKTAEVADIPMFIIKQLLNQALYKFEYCIHEFKCYSSPSYNLLYCKKCKEVHSIIEIEKVESDISFLSLKESIKDGKIQI